MPRSVDDWGTVGAALGRVLVLPPPAWVHPATVDAMRSALAALRRDALDAIEGVTTYKAPKLLGIGRTSVMAALAPGGWLALCRPNAPLSEVLAAHDARKVSRPLPDPGSSATPKCAGVRRS